MKSVCIQNYPGPYFAAFGLSRERYEVSLRIQSKCGKIRTKITPNTDTFYAVNLLYCTKFDSKNNRWNFNFSISCIYVEVSNPAGNYIFKVNNRNTRTSSVVNFEQVDAGWEMSRMNTPTSQNCICSYRLCKMRGFHWLAWFLRIYSMNFNLLNLLNL